MTQSTRSLPDSPPQPASHGQTRRPRSRSRSQPPRRHVSRSRSRSRSIFRYWSRSPPHRRHIRFPREEYRIRDTAYWMSRSISPSPSSDREPFVCTRGEQQFRILYMEAISPSHSTGQSPHLYIRRTETYTSSRHRSFRRNDSSSVRTHREPHRYHVPRDTQSLSLPPRRHGESVVFTEPYYASGRPSPDHQLDPEMSLSDDQDSSLKYALHHDIQDSPISPASSHFLHSLLIERSSSTSAPRHTSGSAPLRRYDPAGS